MSAAEFNSTAVQPFWATRDKALVEHLDLYPQVLETLSAAKDRGIPTVVLSDAPTYNRTATSDPHGAGSRLGRAQMARVQSMLDIVNGPSSGAAPQSGRLGTSQLCRAYKRAILKSFEKPHTQGFRL